VLSIKFNLRTSVYANSVTRVRRIDARSIAFLSLSDSKHHPIRPPFGGGGRIRPVGQCWSEYGVSSVRVMGIFFWQHCLPLPKFFPVPWDLRPTIRPVRPLCFATISVSLSHPLNHLISSRRLLLPENLLVS
jgi:hypothetical protein